MKSMHRLALATCLAACLPWGAQAQSLTEIKVSYQPALYWALPFYVATEKNWWAELGLKPLARHYDHMAAFFVEPRLKAAFTFQDVYMGLSPFEAPATFSMMPYTELAHGVWYPRGGMYSM